MRLFEEYLARHNLDVPLVHHCANGTLLLESTTRPKNGMWSSRWILVSIKWIDEDHHPGYYRIEMNIPVYNGYSKGTLFTKQLKVEKKWQEYESFFLNWAGSLTGMRSISDKMENILTAWEMFVFICDEWFSSQYGNLSGREARRGVYLNSDQIQARIDHCPTILKQKLFQSLDKENSISTRYSNYQDVAIFLSTHHPAVMQAWHEVLASLQNRADWLACLIEKNYESAQKEPTQKDIVFEKSL